MKVFVVLNDKDVDGAYLVKSDALARKVELGEGEKIKVVETDLYQKSELLMDSHYLGSVPNLSD